MWIYIYKTDKHRRFDKCKARLVVRGDQQAHVLSEETYASTLAGRSFRALIAIAARFDLRLIQYDAVNAFVNAPLDTDVFIRMPPGYRRPGTILKLQKALYRLRISPLLWQKELSTTLKALGCEPVPHKPCCYTLNRVLLFFYVDDIVLAYKPEERNTAYGLINQLKSKYKLTGGGNLQWFLGIEIIRDLKTRRIWLSQASYIEKITNLAETVTPDQTPMSAEELLPSDGRAHFSEINRFQRKIGSLLYVAVISRPDIAFTVSRLTHFLTNPSAAHQRAADQVLRYLYRTRGYALRFGGEDDFIVASNASFANNTLDQKSSQTYIIKLFSRLIGWRASKQTTVTTSTTEAELLALAQAAKKAIYVRRLLKELSVQLDEQSIRIQYNNQQTIKLVTKEAAQLKTQLRHVDIHNH